MSGFYGLMVVWGNEPKRVGLEVCGLFTFTFLTNLRFSKINHTYILKT